MARYPMADGVLEFAIAIHRTTAPAHVAHRQASRQRAMTRVAGQPICGVCRWKGEFEITTALVMANSAVLHCRSIDERKPQNNSATA